MNTPDSDPNALFRAGDPDFVTSLARRAPCHRAFTGFDRRLTIADVSRATGLTRAGEYAADLSTLRELGYAGTDGRTFFLQPKVLNLGYAYLSTAPVPIAAQPVLEDVSRALDESSSVAVLEEGSVVFVARSATDGSCPSRCAVGRVPSYCTALGRVLLAHLEPEQVTNQLATTDFLAHTRHTVPSRKKLDDILSTVRRQGYALNDQELEIGLRSIAVPVRNVVGEVVAAMNVGAQASRVSLRRWSIPSCLCCVRPPIDSAASCLLPQ